MQFDLPQRRSRPESVVPMINIVFLLLIFFLMTAQIAPPPRSKLPRRLPKSKRLLTVPLRCISTPRAHLPLRTPKVTVR